MEMGNPVLANVILIGALGATGVLPIDVEIVEEVLAATVGSEKVPLNREAFHKGAAMLQTKDGGVA